MTTTADAVGQDALGDDEPEKPRLYSRAWLVAFLQTPNFAAATPPFFDGGLRPGRSGPPLAADTLERIYHLARCRGYATPRPNRTTPAL